MVSAPVSSTTSTIDAFGPSPSLPKLNVRADTVGHLGSAAVARRRAVLPTLAGAVVQFAAQRFIAGEPIKPATKEVFCGRS